MSSCWNAIGVIGDGSCRELTALVHCRNCPVYRAGATSLLERDASVTDIGESTAHVAQARATTDRQTQSVVIFRVGGEWLALPTPSVTEVANRLPIHSLPHRPSGVILGLTSVRGELLVCMSLGRVLGIESSTDTVGPIGRQAQQRILVIHREQTRAVCPVDEVHGIHRFHPRELTDAPATLDRTATYSTAVLAWRGRSVGLLDAEPLFRVLKRSVA